MKRGVIMELPLPSILSRERGNLEPLIHARAHPQIERLDAREQRQMPVAGAVEIRYTQRSRTKQGALSTMLGRLTL
jgi:hypothetical protein